MLASQNGSDTVSRWLAPRLLTPHCAGNTVFSINGVICSLKRYLRIVGAMTPDYLSKLWAVSVLSAGVGFLRTYQGRDDDADILGSIKSPDITSDIWGSKNV